MKLKLQIFILIGVFFLVFNVAGFSQILKEVNGRISVKLKVPDAKYFQYDTSGKAKRIFSDVSQVKATTPEELMQSIYSSDNQKWVNFNYYKPEQAVKYSKKDYKERFNKNVDTNFFELVHKLEFLYNTIPTAYIKYWFVKEGVRKSLHSFTMQKISDRWYIIDIPELKDQQNTIENIQSEMFVGLYRGKGKKDDLLDQLIKETRGVYNVLDFTRLTEIFKQWEKQNNLSMLRHFCDGY